IGAASDAVFEALEKCNRRRRRAAVHSDLEENMPRMRRFAAPLEKLDNMKSSGRFHDIGNLVFLQRKDGFFKILDELPPAPGAEIATRRGRCRVLGVPAREVRKVSPRLDRVENPGRLRLHRGFRSFARPWDFEYMINLRLLRHGGQAVFECLVELLHLAPGWLDTPEFRFLQILDEKLFARLIPELALHSRDRHAVQLLKFFLGAHLVNALRNESVKLTRHFFLANGDRR